MYKLHFLVYNNHVSKSYQIQNMTDHAIAQTILDELKSTFDIKVLTSKTIYDVARKHGMKFKDIDSFFLKKHLKVGRGKFNLSSLAYGQNSTEVSEPVASTPSAKLNLACSVSSVSNDDVYIPTVDHNFVRWGEYSNIQRIIESRMFFPVYISGMSGNGKTMMVEQACAKLKREYIRVQISPETDEDDLIGGFRLINGETVFQKGPVIKAMERGCILLIDELDRGSNKIMCLQGVLEGKPILIKKIGQVVSPAQGFNVIATANTKGRGSDDGRYSAANIIDEAFIERFVATIDQPYPNFKVERNIVSKYIEYYNIDDNEFADKLVSWSSVIRKTYDAEGIDELISTRRLCHIVKAYSIFSDRLTAISMCIARFEKETREAFLDLYTKIDSNQIQASDDAVATPSAPAEEEPPF
jgi:hypothetical protein